MRNAKKSIAAILVVLLMLLQPLTTLALTNENPEMATDKVVEPGTSQEVNVEGEASQPEASEGENNGGEQTEPQPDENITQDESISLEPSVQISGDVRDSEDNLVSRGWIEITYPDDHTEEITINQDGTYEISGLEDGEYGLKAVPDPEDDEKYQPANEVIVTITDNVAEPSTVAFQFDIVDVEPIEPEPAEETTQDKMSSLEISAQESDVIIFDDANLETEIRTVLNKLEGDILVSDVEAIENLTLNHIDITSLNGIQYLTNLHNLTLDTNNISDISILSQLPSLTNLYIINNPIDNISSLSSLTNLTHLALDNINTSDLSALKDLVNLTNLYLIENSISDLTQLSGLINLRMLDIYGNQVSDITPLKDLTNLQYLLLENNDINDISPLNNLMNLLELDLSENNITNLSPLGGLTDLTTLVLMNNQITDISNLGGLINLTTLLLAGNYISDYSPVSSYYDQLTTVDFVLSIGFNITDTNPSILPEGGDWVHFEIFTDKDLSGIGTFQFELFEVGSDVNIFEIDFSEIRDNETLIVHGRLSDSYNNDNGFINDVQYEMRLTIDGVTATKILDTTDRPFIEHVENLPYGEGYCKTTLHGFDLQKIVDENIQFVLVDLGNGEQIDSIDVYEKEGDYFIEFDLGGFTDISIDENLSLQVANGEEVYFYHGNEIYVNVTDQPYILNLEWNRVYETRDDENNPNYEFVFYGYNLGGESFTADLVDDHDHDNIILTLVEMGDDGPQGSPDKITFYFPKDKVPNGDYMISLHDFGDWSTFDLVQKTNIEVDVDKHIINAGESTDVTITVRSNGDPLSGKLVEIDGYGSGITDIYGEVTLNVDATNIDWSEELNIFVDGERYERILFIVNDREGVVEVTANDKYGNPLIDFSIKVINTYSRWHGDTDVYKDTAFAMGESGNVDILLVKDGHSGEDSYYLVKNVNITAGQINPVHIDAATAVRASIDFKVDNTPIKNTIIRLRKSDTIFNNNGYYRYIGNADENGNKIIYVTPGMYHLSIDGRNDSDARVLLVKNDIDLNIDANLSYDWYSSNMGEVNITTSEDNSSSDGIWLDIDNGSSISYIHLYDIEPLLLEQGTYRIDRLSLEIKDPWARYYFKDFDGNALTFSVSEGSTQDIHISLSEEHSDIVIFHNEELRLDEYIVYGVEFKTVSGLWLEHIENYDSMHVTIVKPDGSTEDLGRKYFRDAGYYLSYDMPIGIYTINADMDMGPLYGAKNFSKTFEIIQEEFKFYEVLPHILAEGAQDIWMELYTNRIIDDGGTFEVELYEQNGSENIADVIDHHFWDYTDTRVDVKLKIKDSYNNGNGLIAGQKYVLKLIKNGEEAIKEFDVTDKPYIEGIHPWQIPYGYSSFAIEMFGYKLDQIIDNNVELTLKDEETGFELADLTSYRDGNDYFIRFENVDWSKLSLGDRPWITSNVDGEVYFFFPEGRYVEVSNEEIVSHLDYNRVIETKNDINNPNYEFSFEGFYLDGKTITAGLVEASNYDNVILSIDAVGVKGENGAPDEITFLFPKDKVSSGEYKIGINGFGYWGTFTFEQNSNTQFDLNGDWKVDLLDLSIAASSYGKKNGEAGFLQEADFNEDGLIDIFDLVILAKNIQIDTL